MQTDPPADLHHEHRQRDGNSQPSVEDVVQAAVAWIVVIVAVAAEAFFLEQELAQPVECLHRIAHEAGARPPGQRVESLPLAGRRQVGMLDARDLECAPGEIELRLGAADGVAKGPERLIHQHPGA